MEFNNKKTEVKSPSEKIKELTVYRYINKDNINLPTNESTSYNEPEEIDDNYILGLHQQLAQKRKIRKISEQGVCILNRRVRCLEAENKKAQSRIDETKRKTKEKLLVLEFNKSRSLEKKEIKERKESELEIKKQKNRQQKMTTKNNILNMKANLFFKNQIKGKISKAQKMEYANQIKENELNQKIINKNKIRIIMNQNYSLEKKKKMSEIEKKEKLIKELEDKIKDEEKKKKEIEDELAKLSEIENGILERILENSENQKKLIENFEKNLQGKSVFLSPKNKTSKKIDFFQ